MEPYQICVSNGNVVCVGGTEKESGRVQEAERGRTHAQRPRRGNERGNRVRDASTTKWAESHALPQTGICSI